VLLRTKSWRSTEIVPRIQESTMLSKTLPRQSLDRGHGIIEDVVVEGVAAESEYHQIPPTGV
jgi:hypothetical protein